MQKKCFFTFSKINGNVKVIVMANKARKASSGFYKLYYFLIFFKPQQVFKKNRKIKKPVEVLKNRKIKRPT